MSARRLLLCADLDRTLIPNGPQPEHPAARHLFGAFCRLPEIRLVYVTGRHQTLVQQAIVDYALPVPDFVITDVGTQIYQLSGDSWQLNMRWQQRVAAEWPGESRTQLEACLSPLTDLRLQEASKQNRFKLSYYLSPESGSGKIMQEITDRLQRTGVNASLIWSIDEQENVGLMDLLPPNATKFNALHFLQQELGYQPHRQIFAGDSGKDLPVLTSGVLVANASAEIRHQARQLAEQKGQAEALYLASETGSKLGENYAAGILQGVRHFAPEFCDSLQQLQRSL